MFLFCYFASLIIVRNGNAKSFCFFINEEMNHKASFATVYVHCNKECNEVKESEGTFSVGGALRAVSLLSSFCNNEQNRCIECFHPPVLMLIVDLRMNKIRISKTRYRVIPLLGSRH